MRTLAVRGAPLSEFTPGGAGAGRVSVLAALVTVYILWGSTYLAIRFAVETLPPFLMAGVRFLIAGAILYGWRRLRGEPRPTWIGWRAATVVGALLLLGGNGGVVWSEQWVESGTAALMVATVPFWMVLFDWIRPGGTRPRAVVWTGIVMGLIGVAMLVGRPDFSGGHGMGELVLLFAAMSWAAGSLYARTPALPSSLLATGMEMLAGGVLLTVFGIAIGELGDVDPATFSTRSILAMAYLIVFGSLLGFTCYVWLLRVASPALVSTYAYVNPVVAVALGAMFAGEVLTPRIGVAAAVIVGGVVLITTAQYHARRAARRADS